MIIEVCGFGCLWLKVLCFGKIRCIFVFCIFFNVWIDCVNLFFMVCRWFICCMKEFMVRLVELLNNF